MSDIPQSPASPARRRPGRSPRPAPVVDYPGDEPVDEVVQGDGGFAGNGNGVEAPAIATVPRRALPPLPDAMLTFETTFTAKPPIPFKIVAAVEPSERGGLPGREEHVFWAEGDPGAGGIMAMSGLVHWDATGKANIDLNAIKAFFQRVLIDDGYDQFVELLDRRDVQIQMELLSDITDKLMRKYTGRP